MARATDVIDRAKAALAAPSSGKANPIAEHGCRRARFKLKLRDLKDAPCRSRRQSPMGMLAKIPVGSAKLKLTRRSRRGFRWPMQLEGFACPDEVRQGSHGHLPHNVTAVNLDGDFTQPEFSRHLFVHEPSRHKRHDLPFAWRERVETLAQFGERFVAIPSLAVPFDRLRDGIEHILIAERLRQEVDSP